MAKNNRKTKGKKIEYRKFRIYSAIIAMILAVVTGAFVVLGNYIVPLAVFAIASGLMYFLKTRVNEVLYDERIEKISGKTSRAVYTILVIGMALASIVLMAEKAKNPAYELLAFTLSCTACGAMLLYILLFKYFSAKEQ
ncbi:MAG: DUF2178 domain-containing protein [archaeon]